MKDSLYMAWRYLLFNRAKSTILIACLTVVITLPLALQLIVTQAQQELTSRAKDTPLVIGAKGSSLDLVINTLYFTGNAPERTSMETFNRVNDSNLAQAIPLYNRFQTTHYPIVGTSIEYFSFRSLNIEEGTFFTFLGEAVIGANVAKALNLKVGDHVISSPDNMFDLAGTYPLKMPVVGILKKSHTPDDEAVFVDIKTTWIIEGIGHGHKDLSKANDSTVILSEEKNTITANAKLVEYNEITPDNIGSFHFHGDLSQYPLTAVLAVAPDQKSESILRGRFNGAEETQQAVIPVRIVDDLIETIFSIKSVFDVVLMTVGGAMLLALMLILVLSVRMREREIETITKLGCKQLKIAEMLTSEILLISTISLVISTCLLLIIYTQKQLLIEWLIL